MDLIAVCGAEHFYEEPGIEGYHQVFTVILAFHPLISFETKINILCCQLQFTTTDVQGYLVGTLITEHTYAAERALEIILIYSETIRIISWNNHFIIREACIDQAAAHLRGPHPHKQVITIVADGYLFIIGGNGCLQQVEGFAGGNERICFGTAYIRSFITNEAMSIRGNTLKSFFIKFKDHNSHSGPQVIITCSEQCFIYRCYQGGGRHGK
jgi:hypothetical protein